MFIVDDIISWLLSETMDGVVKIVKHIKVNNVYKHYFTIADETLESFLVAYKEACARYVQNFHKGNKSNCLCFFPGVMEVCINHFILAFEFEKDLTEKIKSACRSMPDKPISDIAYINFSDILYSQISRQEGIKKYFDTKNFVELLTRQHIEVMSKLNSISPTIMDDNEILSCISANSKRILYNHVSPGGKFSRLAEIIDFNLFAPLKSIDIDEVDKRTLTKIFSIPVIQCLENIDNMEKKYTKLMHNKNDENERTSIAEKCVGRKGVIITGNGGMGKTVSMLVLWKEIIEKMNRAVIYVQLNEFNDIDFSVSNELLIKKIITSYLPYSAHNGNYSEIQEKLIALLNKKSREEERVVILLDGFNELRSNVRDLLEKDVSRLLKFDGVVIYLVSRDNLSFFMEDDPYLLQKFKVLPLEDKQKCLYLEKFNIPTPNKDVLNLLGNVLMITLYVQTCEWISRTKGGKLFRFIEDITNEGNLINNFFETLLCKNYYDRATSKSQLL